MEKKEAEEKVGVGRVGRRKQKEGRGQEDEEWVVERGRDGG